MMTVAAFINMLAKYPQDANILVARRNHDGCDTCGWGETSTECDIRLVDLETKVVIEANE